MSKNQIKTTLRTTESAESYEKTMAALSTPDPSPEQAKAFFAKSEIDAGSKNEEDEEDEELMGGDMNDEDREEEDEANED